MNYQELPNGKVQGFGDHIVELRDRVIKMLLIMAVGSLICFMYSELLFEIIKAPISPYLKNGLAYTGVMDKFVAHIKVSIVAGCILTAPFWLFQLWKFIAPGLYNKEKTFALSMIGFGTLLFISGVSFVYFLVLPACFDFLMNFGGQTDVAMITIDNYVNFFTTMSLVFGFMFELPLVLVLLGLMGIITYETLINIRRYMIVIFAILSGVLTPPDLMSQIFLLVPLCILYELSIIILKYFVKQNNSQKA